MAAAENDIEKARKKKALEAEAEACADQFADILDEACDIAEADTVDVLRLARQLALLHELTEHLIEPDITPNAEVNVALDEMAETLDNATGLLRSVEVENAPLRALVKDVLDRARAQLGRNAPVVRLLSAALATDYDPTMLSALEALYASYDEETLQLIVGDMEGAEDEEPEGAKDK